MTVAVHVAELLTCEPCYTQVLTLYCARQYGVLYVRHAVWDCAGVVLESFPLAVGVCVTGRQIEHEVMVSEVLLGLNMG
jgi:hypothetical protein